MKLEIALQIFLLSSSIFFTVIAYINRAVTMPNNKIWHFSKGYPFKKALVMSLLFFFLFHAFILQKEYTFAESTPVQWILQQSANKASATELTKGLTYETGIREILYYNQEDSRWGNEKYGKTDLISQTGCGPTSLAMVISTLTDTIINPKEMADWAYTHGYCAEGSGSYHTLIQEGAEAFGLSVEQAKVTEGQKIADALADGKFVIALLGEGAFTSSGHFIVLRGITKEGNVFVADPKSIQKSQKIFSLGLLLEEAKGGANSLGPFWIIS